MFEIGWTEMLVIAVVMIVVVGPKDLPQMLRQIGRTTSKLRGMAGDFRRQFDEALKEAELDDVKKSVDALRGLNPTTAIRKQMNPFQQAAQDVRAGLETAMKPKPQPPIAAQPAAATAHPAEPLKVGPVSETAGGTMPGTGPGTGPEAAPAAVPEAAPTPAPVDAEEPAKAAAPEPRP